MFQKGEGNGNEKNVKIKIYENVRQIMTKTLNVGSVACVSLMWGVPLWLAPQPYVLPQRQCRMGYPAQLH